MSSVLLMLMSGVIASQASDATQKIEFIRLSYKANKDAFVRCSSHFEYTTASAASLREAEARAFVNPVKAEGYYAFEGKNARYELVVGADGLAARSKGINERRVTTSVESFRLLTDGKDTLMDGIFLDDSTNSVFHKPSIFPGSRLFSKHLDFPLYLGDDARRDYDLYSDLGGIQDGLATLVEFQEGARLGDSQVCLIKFKFAAGERTYWIDVDKGCVPVRMLNHSTSGTDTVTVNYDVTAVAGGGWIPHRKLHVFQNGAIVKELVIKDIDAEKPPRSSVFELEFEEPVRIVDQPKKLGYAPRRKWGLLNRPKSNSPGVTPAISSLYVSPADLPGELIRPFPWLAIILTVVAGLAVLALLAIVVKRRAVSTGA